MVDIFSWFILISFPTCQGRKPAEQSEKTFFGHFMELKLLLFWERKKENRYTCLTRERERSHYSPSTVCVCVRQKKVIVYKVCGGLKLSIKDPKISRIFLLNFLGFFYYYFRLVLVLRRAKYIKRKLSSNSNGFHSSGGSEEEGGKLHSLF